jgi:hypothetical protein
MASLKVHRSIPKLISVSPDNMPEISMAKKKAGPKETEEVIELEAEESQPVMSENAIIDVAFGEPEDGLEEEEQILNWVASFPPGQFQRQVADLFLSEGDIYIIMDKLSVVVPLMELFRLLETAGGAQKIKEAE